MSTYDKVTVIYGDKEQHHQLKDTNAAKSITSSSFNRAYDILAALISLADIITDFIIMVQFYLQQRMLFFYLSLSIIILANLSYVLVFLKRYNSGPTFCNLMCVLCMLLPIAPCISFLMYFMDDENSRVSRCMFGDHISRGCLIGFNFLFYDREKDQNNSELQQWFESKLSKHIGWILESLLESLPQTILQMIAIVYYNELNAVFFVSIILSILSISTKALVFSASISITNKTMIYTWISSIADLVGLFMCIAWLFSSSDDHAVQAALDLIRTLYLYKLLLFVAPLCIYCSVGIYVYSMGAVGDHYCYGNRCEDVGVGCIGCFGVGILWAFGVLLGMMALEISCFMYIAYFLYDIGHGRIPHTKSNRIWLNLLDFIQHQAISYTLGTLQVSKTQDQIVRICTVNRQLLLMKNVNPKLHDFLTVKEHQTQFRDVRYSDIRSLTMAAILASNGTNASLLWYKLKYSYNAFNAKFVKAGGICIGYSFILWKLLVPWYLLSRCLQIMSPYMMVIILYSHSASFYREIHVFQWVMLAAYCFLQWMAVILLMSNYTEEHIIFHLAPTLCGANCLYKYLDDMFFKMCSGYYDRLIVKPIILNVLCDIFQPDIGKLIFEFIPFYLDEEQHAALLREKASEYTKEAPERWTHPVISAAFRK